MSKRGSHIARHAIFAVNLDAVMHKVCNIIFALLRDGRSFELRSPEEHLQNYKPQFILTT